MMLKVWRSFSQFWATDRGLSIFLMIIIALVFVLPPLGKGRLITDIFFALLLISGVSSISRSKKVLVIVAGVSIVALAFRWIDSLNASPFLHVLDYIAAIVSIGLFCVVVLAQVMKKGPITVHRIMGAIAVYLLLGLAWAHAYELIAYTDPAAFAGAVVTDGGRFSSWTYFSLVTLATLGYGDIAPVNPVARSLVTAETITGQLYLAILIARLVSQELYYRQVPTDGTRGNVDKDGEH